MVGIEKTLSNTTGRFFFPVSLVLACDGFNIFSYVTEWALFAVYYKTVFDWSSALTGAAQMAGDLFAAAILALTTTKCWAWCIRKDATDRLRPSIDSSETSLYLATHRCIHYEKACSLEHCCVRYAMLIRLFCGAGMWRVDRMLLQPPWNIAIFFLLYALCFMLLVQDTFTVSVVGQVCMGTLFVRADPASLSLSFSMHVTNERSNTTHFDPPTALEL